MSYLFAIPKSADRIGIPILSHLFKQKYYSEMGVAYAKDGVLHRMVGFSSVPELLNYLENVIQFDAAIAYANNPTRKFPQTNYSPLLISDDYAFASCGNVLELTQLHEGQSNTEVFANQILRPCSVDAPGIMDMPQFNWMLSSIARKYVGLAFLRKDGHINLIHKDVFKQTTSGIYHVEFDRAKAESFKYTPHVSYK